MSKTFTGFMMGLVLLFAVIKAAGASEPKVASGIVIAQCNKTIGVIIVDVRGTLHPVEPGKLEAGSLDELLLTIPTGKGVTVTVPCIKALEEV